MNHSPTSSNPQGFLPEPQCVHCGLCLAHCPTYLETGDENESPRGRLYLMRALETGRIAPTERVLGHLDLCLDCRACEVACPCGVPYGKLLEQARERWGASHAHSFVGSLWAHWGPSFLFTRPWALRTAVRLGNWVRGTALERLLPQSLRESLRLVPRRMGTHHLPDRAPAFPEKGKIALFHGCVTQSVSGFINQAAIHILNRLGFTVDCWKGQVCCGALHAHSGQLARARELAKRNLTSWEAAGGLPIVVTAAGCGSILREYGELLRGEAAWAARARLFSEKVYDLSVWLDQHGIDKLLRGVKPPPYRVTYHEACHLAHAQRVREEPKRIVQMVAGPSFVELPEAELCCGSAGVYNLVQPAMARRLQQRKINHIRTTGAGCVVTTNPGCMYQIEAGLVEVGITDVRVVHLSEFLCEALAGGHAP
ncbi:(Fe-S)-binding protein [Candidatus Methylacidithermus pantelleriae]|uniref:Glycolate oxidase iron-sulfur subunit n=1 Tax=Candidatus Methylacidithermus pantelleriae TaxID=2744239 RepID=A0A8J2BMX7_9BACT|nr:heterodisulfide reductase-related iron-sulfur binding cluster [Candidatus Methylacidithermus pantelleriae]CAF0691522.1 Glycolate dehydrogenase, iron-sulfur subunit GlcF [Candidatus Methylacidithermus pantelleriae]